MAVAVTENLFWVGARDPELRVFDIIMRTDDGTTYNAYVLKGDKNILFETVKNVPTFYDEFVSKIEEVIGKDGKIDFIVHNHTEPDHSGSAFRLLLEKYKEAKVIGTRNAIDYLKDITNFPDFEEKYVHSVIEKETELELGEHSLTFLPAPFLHWPDSMFTLIKKEKALITCDFLGAHYCEVKDEAIFSDNATQDYSENFKYYYDCIFGPFPSYVRKGLEIIDKNREMIDYICCSHGQIIRGNLDMFLNKYRAWSTSSEPLKRVVIAYVSAYGYTAKMAESIKNGIERVGVEVGMYDVVSAENQAEALADLGRGAGGLLLGTPTIVGEALPPIWDIATKLNPIVHQNLYCGSFGSFGWSGEGTKNIDERFSQVRCKLPLDPLVVKFNPSGMDLKKCEEFGEKFGAAVNGEPIMERTVEDKRSKKIKRPNFVNNGKVRSWKCVVCGEIFSGYLPPEICPACGATMEQFVEVFPENDQLDKTKERSHYDGHVVVIGGGGAGVNAIAAMRDLSTTVKITLICKENELPYYRPAVSDLIGDSDVEHSEKWLIKPKEWYEENNINVMLGTAVDRVDYSIKTVFTQGKELQYDRLMLATGSSNFVPIKGAMDYENVFSIRTADDARSLTQYIKANNPQKVLFVGGGILALEAASALSEDLKVPDTVIVECLPNILPMQLDSVGSEILEDHLTKQGVTLNFNCFGTSLSSEGKVAKALELRDKTLLTFDLLVFSVGVRSNISLGGDAVKCNRGFVVDNHMNTSVEGVFACGDCAECDGMCIPSWPVAVEQGKVAGRNAVGITSEYKKGRYPYLLDAFGTKIYSFGDWKGASVEEVSVNRTKDTYRHLCGNEEEKLKGVILIGDISDSVMLTQGVEAEIPISEL